MNPPPARCDGRAACRCRGDSGGGFLMSERREQRAAEQLQRVADRWTTMSGGVESRHAATGMLAVGPDDQRAGARRELPTPSQRTEDSAAAGVAPGPLTLQCAKADAATSPDRSLQSRAASSAPTYTNPARKSPFWRWT